MHSLEQVLLAALRDLRDVSRYVIAYSGGLDSTVLLHLCAAARDRLGAPLAAVHVDHGLHPHSARWAAHCGTVCEALNVPLTVLCVDAAGARAARGVEAAARDARYSALARLLGERDCLVTAHHCEDQAETVLLQLLRGSGPAGLAAMPAITPLGSGLLARPLLGVARAALRAHAEHCRLRWLDDPSNRDPSLGRGYLRSEVLPRLRARWPGTDGALVRAARHCADATTIIESAAAQDLASLATASAWQLSLVALRELPAARQRAALRHWCARQGVPVPDAARLDEALAQILAAEPARAAQVEWPGGALRRYRDRVHLDPGLAPLGGLRVLPWRADAVLDLSAGLGTLALVPGGALSARLRDARLEVRFRAAGQRVAVAGRNGRHRLKNLYQEAGVPPWLRERVPILHADGEPVVVGDRWVCAAFAARAGEAGVGLRWERPAWLGHWTNAPADVVRQRGHETGAL